MAGRKKTVDGETQPVSFRIGSVYKAKLTRLAALYEVSQTELFKKLIDTVYKAKFGDSPPVVKTDNR